jgi:hypothetical protein
MDPEEINDRVQIAYLLLADHAEVSNGKLTAMGIGWDVVPQSVASVGADGQLIPPPPIRMAVAVGLSVGWHHTNEAIPLEIRLEDSDGKVLFQLKGSVTAGRAANQPQGTPVRWTMAWPLLVGVQQPGRHRVILTLPEHRDQREWGFTVLPPPPGIPFASTTLLPPSSPPPTPQ